MFLGYLKKCVMGFVVMTSLGFSAVGFAMDKKPFVLAEFERLKNNGEVVLVDVFADWCSTCKKQQKALKTYLKQHPDRNLHILEVDFDNQKDIVTLLRAPRQSTLLLFKGDDQFWFSVAETRKEVISTKIEQAFNYVPKES